MNHVSVHLNHNHLRLITELQLTFQSRLDEYHGKLSQLSDSPMIDVQATLPQLEADFCVLASMSSNINHNIQAANGHSG